jgi:antitoxin (DNA-binding transcriptional repressor) of toxin-antitoxin stability system
MIQVNIHEAKTRLSELLERVQGGEEVIIAKAGKPIAKLGQLETKQKERRPGRLKGKIRVIGNFSDADAEIAAMFENSRIFPDGDV